MKAKLFRLFFVGIFLMSGMSIYAQTYICLQKDIEAVAVSSDGYLKLYKNSTLEVSDTLKVRVVSMTDAAKGKQKNILFRKDYRLQHGRAVVCSLFVLN